MENYCAFSKNHACLKWLDYGKRSIGGTLVDLPIFLDN